MDYRTWEKTFRADARADNYRVFRDVLAKLGLPDKPLLMLRGTVDMVLACCAYNRMDNNGFFEPFLRLQTYAPETLADNLYTFTFDVFGKAYARIMVNEKFRGLDLADMFDFPWQRHKMAGFRCFWISHASWRALKKREIKRLEQEVQEDLYYDFTEDELDVWFDVVRDGTCLLVNLLEKEPLSDEDDCQCTGQDISSESADGDGIQKRWCKYILQQGSECSLLGCTEVPQGMDVDDAFPVFHAAHYGKRAKDELADAIRDGALLIAESNIEERCLLAYRIDDPYYWYGREATLKYLGVVDFRHAC